MSPSIPCALYYSGERSCGVVSCADCVGEERSASSKKLMEKWKLK
jgi:hypothetical protein